MSTYTKKIKLPEIGKFINYETVKLSKKRNSSIHNEYYKTQSKTSLNYIKIKQGLTTNNSNIDHNDLSMSDLTEIKLQDKY